MNHDVIVYIVRFLSHPTYCGLLKYRMARRYATVYRLVGNAVRMYVYYISTYYNIMIYYNGGGGEETATAFTASYTLTVGLYIIILRFRRTTKVKRALDNIYNMMGTSRVSRGTVRFRRCIIYCRYAFTRARGYC